MTNRGSWMIYMLIIIIFLLPICSYLQKGDKLALLLDYDGTLAPMASHPNNTVMEPESEASLLRLASHPSVFLAFISGREAQDVKNKVGLPNAIYGGNHGLQIIYADNTRFNYQIAQEVKDNLILMVAALEEQVNRETSIKQNILSNIMCLFNSLQETVHGWRTRTHHFRFTIARFLENCTLNLTAKPPKSSRHSATLQIRHTVLSKQSHPCIGTKVSVT